MVFADQLQLVVETVAHDQVPGIVHHQRVWTTELQVTFAPASEASGDLPVVVVDDVDAIQTNI